MAVEPLVIVGAGPAGLAAAHAVLAAGGERFLVLDAGGSVDARRRDDPRDLVEGVGGAGLYSDGKFSFFPAASALWSLPDEQALGTAFRWTTRLLGAHGLEAPAYPTRPAPAPREGFKPYPSIYLPFEARTQLIASLGGALGERLRLRHRLESVEREGELLRLSVRTARGRETIRCRRLIGAGGRFFPLLLRGLPTTFRRHELGVRIEGPAEHAFFADLLQAGRSIDPKLILNGDPAIEWRTFCCCARGEVVETDAGGLRTLSGRSDGPPTGRSNVGFNVRYRTPASAAGVDLERVRAQGTFAVPLADAVASPAALASGFGDAVAADLVRGLRRLATRVPSLLHAPQRLTVRGPAVEGVGDYPLCDRDLRVPGLPIHLAGDCGGVFRGIVAALVSGHYAGGQAAEALGVRGLAYSARP